MRIWDASQDDQSQRTLGRVYQLYRAVALAASAPTRVSGPLQFHLDGEYERVFCIIGESLQLFMAMPAWQDVPEGSLNRIFTWLRQHELTLFASVSLLDNY